MPIYTKTGDSGQTSLAGGARVSKADPRVGVYGTIDELNSHIGLLVAHLSEPLTTLGNHVAQYLETLARIQHDLTTIGGIIAGADVHTPEHDFLETAIDEIAPKWQGFVIPTGVVTAAQAHVCRTVCRRAERLLVALDADAPKIPHSTQPSQVYLNRLSDYLYALALEINRLSGMPEQIWKN
ncbi:MAG: cob(I)yrinic acid a,c-diamide adenosyltransferase [Bacteroidaceae bacterium]|nr:cob(I)yrinic acid a,c-diamide adenosyltransferase [Bacteroidaceae bacterium]